VLSTKHYKGTLLSVDSRTCDGTPSESNQLRTTWLDRTLLAYRRLRPKSLLFTPLAGVNTQRISCIYSAAPLILTCEA